jgi:short-subunit dehydrogenase
MSERVIVITGASAGIGAALARELGGRGHTLVLAARREPELREVAASAGAGKEKTLTVVADVTRRQDVERIRDEALKAFGRVDVWINNAGRGISRSVLELTDDDVDAMISTNLKSALYGMQAIVPHFMARGDGHLINVSSFLGRVPVASVRSVYSASKAALNSLTANLRMDLRASHPRVHVTVVMPGMVSTAFGKNALGADGASLPHGAPPAPGGPFSPQSPEEVAVTIASVIDAPVAEVYTNPVHADLARRYFENVAAAEAQMPGAGPPPRA